MPKIPICIEIHGGLGDQICAEPVIRFITKKWPHYKIYAITHYPELFSHLDIDARSEAIRFDKPCPMACTHPKEDPFMDFHQIHTVDYISIRLLKMTLPLADKQIKINVPLAEKEKVRSLIPNPANTVLIHPGQSWQSKTFFKENWQSYIDAALSLGREVAVIGKNGWVNKEDYRGVVKGLDLCKCIDLVDKLSVLQTCAALDMCPVLISNDSGPIHLSGAFNNHVGIISTIRRPETLFHWRNGIQGFRYYSLERERGYDSLIPDTISGQLSCNMHDLDENKLSRMLPSGEHMKEFLSSKF